MDNKIAMLFGVMLGDGWIEKKRLVGGFSGDKKSLESVKADLKFVFGDIGKATVNTRKTASKKYGIKGTTSQFVINKKTTAKFIEFGMPIGKRAEQEFILPDWIVNGKKETKASFISGIYAAEGFYPLMQKNDKTLKPLGFLLTKRRAFEENFRKLMKQFEDILDSIGIEFNTKHRYTHTCDDNIEIRFDFKNNLKNILLITKVLDVKYCIRKRHALKTVYLYYKRTQDEIDRLTKAYFEAQDRNNLLSSIANKYNITKRHVEHFRYDTKNVKNIQPPKSFYITFTEFKRDCPSKTPLNDETLLIV